MKKLFINGKGQVFLKQVREPLLATKGCLIETHYALISAGTELSVIKSKRFNSLPLIKRFLLSKDFRKKAYKAIQNKSLKKIFKTIKSFTNKYDNKNFSDPLKNLTPIGYSCAGIVKKSNLEGYHVNERVACAGSNHAEVIFSSKNLTCKVPDNVSLKEAAFMALGAIALHGINRADIKPGEFVCVIGTGLIGLIVVQLAKLSGARVFALDLINKRLTLAKRLGADHVFNSRTSNVEMEIKKLTHGYCLDSIIICASSKTSKPLEMAIELIRSKGKIVILGAFPLNINRTKLYNKEPDILISRSYGPGRHDPSYEFEGFDYPEKHVPWTEKRNMKLFLKLISEKKINVKSLISGIISIDKVDTAYERLEADPITNITILMNFFKKKEDLFNATQYEELVQEKMDQKLVIGLIGCGSFAQKVHLPILISHPNCKIKAIATKTKKSAEFCKNKYKPEYITTNYRDILKDPEIDTVFIYTRHDSHKKFTIETLKSKKNVYIEKPMALTMTECKEIYSNVKQYNKNYFIGFNRRHSPFIKIAKNLLRDRSNPIIINYRIANSFLSGTHWLFDPNMGGGPIIGESCHFTDLLLFLMNSKPIEVLARGGSMSHKNLEVYDSFVALIKFENGSIANLIYTDLSSEGTSKERIEIFSGGSTIIIDDFLKLNTTGFDCENHLLNVEDKGYKSEINNVIRSNLDLEKPLIVVEDALLAMKIVFKIIESIKSNKPIKITQDLNE